MNWKSRRGSYIIFITLAFSAVMIMIIAVLWASGQNAISSTVDSFGPLWGKSILAEYDRNLKDRYGLFGFYGNEYLVEEKLSIYVKYSCKEKKYINYGGVSCAVDEYSLAKKENFIKQIKEISLADLKPKKTKTVYEQDTSNQNAYINSEWIISGLPSKGKGGGINPFSLTRKIKEGISLKKIAEQTLENKYIFSFFKDCMNDRGLGQTFFDNEIEYIVSGKLNDKKAKKSVYTTLIVIRNALNLAYLYGCSEKREAALAIAQIISPQFSVAVQALIMESWAYMEARNDLKLLYAGEKVPAIKKDDNWALALDNVISCEYGRDMSGKELNEADKYEEPREYVSPKKIEGSNYEEYLRALVSILPEEKKALRMMDLIQINFKRYYYSDFLIEYYYTGLNYKITINGKEHNFEETY